jgi:hypothetical protein
MTDTIKICDKCGLETRSKQEGYGDYKTIKIEFDSYHDYKEYSCRWVFMLLCSSCMQKIGFVKVAYEKSEVKPPMPAEQLYDLIVEIVQDCTAHLQQGV